MRVEGRDEYLRGSRYLQEPQTTAKGCSGAAKGLGRRGEALFAVEERLSSHKRDVMDTQFFAESCGSRHGLHMPEAAAPTKRGESRWSVF